MAQIIDAQKLIITISDGDEEDPTAIPIGKVVSFSGVDGEASDIEVSHFGTDEYKEFLVGLADEGAFNMNLIYDPADPGQAELFAVSSSVNREYVITWLTGHTLTFMAYVKSVGSGEGSVDTRLDSVANLMIDGEAVFAAPEPEDP